jgi:hypothetical protein
MTVLTLPARPGRDAAPRPVPWQRMIWVTWRQHRATLISLAAVLGALAVFLLAAGLWVHHNFAVLMACRPVNSYTCGALDYSFNNTDWTLGNTLLLFMNLAPALIGAFTGPSVMARELESGTFRYAWTQGIGRVRWAIAKLVLLGAVIAVLTWAFSQLFAWFFAPFLQQQDTLTVLSAGVFVTRGVAFAAWCLISFALGAFLGMLLRRTIAAMAATLGGYLGLTLLTWLFLRERYPVALVTGNASLFAARHSGPLNSFPAATPDNMPWILGTWYTGPGGKPASPSVVNQVLGLFPVHGAPAVREAQAQAFAQHGITQWWRYIPVSRFWPMQFIEAGWLLVLSALLIAATVWLVRRRAA